MNAPLFDDAAPLAGGAGVNDPNNAHDATHRPRTLPARHAAGPSGVAAIRVAGCAASFATDVPRGPAAPDGPEGGEK